MTLISASLRSALEEYLRRNPRVGAAPLFPAERDPAKSIDKNQAGHLLEQAERKPELPKQARGGWHSFRRLWAIKAKHLPDADAARAGGWEDVTTLRKVYQAADAATVLKVVESVGGGHTLDTSQSQVVVNADTSPPP